ncbi:hypothetical protein HII31_08732 [Pseudocercospora fuligena]|uniref:Uncharacterized protein n=1 Tax=Pseudocercospora fuligena TaxID=685502 RepID=A0A8H6VFV6_9PEZI|nr:hypothetical protein HII31_08732 [Pseudocercospora fuligena]
MTTDDKSPDAQAQEKSSSTALDTSSAPSQPGEDSSQGITSTHADQSDAVENRTTMIWIAPSINPSLYSEADPTDATAVTVQQARPTPVAMESRSAAKGQAEADSAAYQPDQREIHTEEGRQARPASVAVAAQEPPASDHTAQQDNHTDENGDSQAWVNDVHARVRDALHEIGIPTRTSGMQYHDETVGPGGYIDPSQPRPPTLLGQQTSATPSQTRPTQFPGGGPWAAPPSPAQTTNTANAERRTHQHDSEEESDSRGSDKQKDNEK